MGSLEWRKQCVVSLVRLRRPGAEATSEVDACGLCDGDVVRGTVLNLSMAVDGASRSTTSTATLLGTTRYMAPELARSEQSIDARERPDPGWRRCSLDARRRQSAAPPYRNSRTPRGYAGDGVPRSRVISRRRRRSARSHLQEAAAKRESGGAAQRRDVAFARRRWLRDRTTFVGYHSGAAGRASPPRHAAAMYRRLQSHRYVAGAISEGGGSSACLVRHSRRP